MIRRFRLIAVIALLLAASCEYENSHGECIGAFDDPDTDMRYTTSCRNVFWAVACSTSVVVPVVVVAAAAKCPAGPKKPKSDDADQ